MYVSYVICIIICFVSTSKHCYNIYESKKVLLTQDILKWLTKEGNDFLYNLHNELILNKVWNLTISYLQLK